MRKLLEDRCYVDMGVVGTKENEGYKEIALPRLPVTEELSICYLYDERVSLPVKALLDTGNDITLVRPETVARLSKELGSNIYQFRATIFTGKKGKNYEPTYRLALAFPGGHIYSSQYGFISPAHDRWDFEDIDVWVGQDIFSQLAVTFDGLNQKVSIFGPNK